MTEYRRVYVTGATWFFTVNLFERRHNSLLVEKVEQLRAAFLYVKDRRPFYVNAAVIMPDHIHCIWTLPAGDADYSTRWNLLKGHFSRSLDRGESVTESRSDRRERGIWQRRFWAHLLSNQEDFNNHLDYIHWNPVKHGWARRVAGRPHSSFHKYVDAGMYMATWGHSGEFDFRTGE